MKIAIITVPRFITPADEQLVRVMVREVIGRGFQIYVGDTEGVMKSFHQFHTKKI